MLRELAHKDPTCARCFNFVATMEIMHKTVNGLTFLKENLDDENSVRPKQNQ